ncbi:hypothetical protein AB0D62_38210 [Streptomyces massasporeus]|uniref:hypothetical protein n=1 Tax=Streptomyces massasporeus TaxID=67324 RepID=UPI0033F05695
MLPALNPVLIFARLSPLARLDEHGSGNALVSAGDPPLEQARSTNKLKTLTAFHQRVEEAAAFGEEPPLTAAELYRNDPTAALAAAEDEILNAACLLARVNPGLLLGRAPPVTA